MSWHSPCCAPVFQAYQGQTSPEKDLNVTGLYRSEEEQASVFETDASPIHPTHLQSRLDHILVTGTSP